MSFTKVPFIQIPLLYFFFLTLGVMFIIWLLQDIFHASYIHPAIWYIAGFIFLQGFISLWITLAGIKRFPQDLIKYVIGSTVARLTLSIMAIYIALKSGIPHRVPFVLNFLILYFVFLVFELFSLLTTLRTNSEKRT